MLAMKNGINKVDKKLKKQATYPNEIFQKNPYILFVLSKKTCKCMETISIQIGKGIHTLLGSCG
jgi:hypothetical protein